MRCVCVESPLRGVDEAAVELNILYAEACMYDCLHRRGEAPFLGHLLYPRVLNDAEPDSRRLGIEGHIAWLCRADAVAVYVDLGITDGMRAAIERAHRSCIVVEHRNLGSDWRGRPDLFFVGTQGVVGPKQALITAPHGRDEVVGYVDASVLADSVAERIRRLEDAVSAQAARIERLELIDSSGCPF